MKAAGAEGKYSPSTISNLEIRHLPISPPEIPAKRVEEPFADNKISLDLLGTSNKPPAAPVAKNKPDFHHPHRADSNTEFIFPKNSLIHHPNRDPWLSICSLAWTKNIFHLVRQRVQLTSVPKPVIRYPHFIPNSTLSISCLGIKFGGHPVSESHPACFQTTTPSS